MKVSERKNLVSQWLVWHFYKVPSFLLQVWGNYFLFATNYFSFTLLLKTFFSPWRRYKWQYPRGFDLSGFFSALISNAFSRFLGALMRIFLIVAGLFLQIFVAVAGAAVIVGWVVAPIAAVFGLALALTL